MTGNPPSGFEPGWTSLSGSHARAFGSSGSRTSLVGRASVPAMLVRNGHSTLHRRDACATNTTSLFRTTADTRRLTLSKDNQAVTDHPSSWGQLLMVGIPGPRVDAVARELVRDLKVGGVILFARNIESPGASLGVDPGPATGGPGGHRAAPAPGGGPGRGPGPAPEGALHHHPGGPGTGRQPPPRRRWSIWPGRWPGNWPWWASTSIWPRFWTCPGRRPAPSGTALTARSRRPWPTTPWPPSEAIWPAGSSRWPNIFPGWGTPWWIPTRSCPWPNPLIPSEKRTCCPSGRP